MVISGLASHPFGSWQERGSDKSYMWVRDALPKHLANIRVLLYGYDTTLVDSRSFQSIGEISGTLRDRLMPMAYPTARSRSIVFLAHSLGGIILKKTLVMLADSGPVGMRLLDRVCGGSEQVHSFNYLSFELVPENTFLFHLCCLQLRDNFRTGYHYSC